MDIMSHIFQFGGVKIGSNTEEIDLFHKICGL